MSTLFYFIIALSILVVVHEWGHFIVARKSGIRIEQFSVGFGPKIFWWFLHNGVFHFCHPLPGNFCLHYQFSKKDGFSIKKYQTKEAPQPIPTGLGGTLYKVSILPLGGFVKLFGEDPVAEAEGNEAKAKEIANAPDAFSRKSLPKRMATVFAGPTMNLLLAFILMPLVYLVGIEVPKFLEEPPVVSQIEKDSPAATSDLKVGDLIVSINGHSMKQWRDVENIVFLNKGTELKFLIDREGEKKELKLTPIKQPGSDHEVGYLGISPRLFLKAVVGSIEKNSPAQKGGLQEKDAVVSINGVKVKTWDDMLKLVRESNGKEIKIDYIRSQGSQVEYKTVFITPHRKNDKEPWRIGIGPYLERVQKKYGFVGAVKEGTGEVIYLTKLTFSFLKKLFSFQLSIKTLAGPAQIASLSGDAARSGLGNFLYFMALLSLNLGILNLLPIPVLDGGHAMFMAIEAIRRKPLSLKIRNVATQLGLALLLFLMVIVTFNDFDRMWGIVEKIKGIF